MKRLFITAGLALLSLLGYAQEIEYKEYSYTEFLQMIESEEDTLFQLENALIFPDLATDSSFFMDYIFLSSRTIPPAKEVVIIDKRIRLQNVQFSSLPKSGAFIFENGNLGLAGLSFLHFKKPVRFDNTYSLHLQFSTFDEELMFSYSVRSEGFLDSIGDKFRHTPSIMIYQSNLQSGFDYDSDHVLSSGDHRVGFTLVNSEINIPINTESNIMNGSNMYIVLWGNHFKGQGVFEIQNVEAENYELTENHFNVPLVTFKSKSLSNSTVEIRDNTFDQHVALSISSLPDNAILNWAQFAGKNFSAAKIWEGFSSMYEEDSINTQGMFGADFFTQDYLERFVNHTIIEDEFYYNEEQKLKGYLIQFYKSVPLFFTKSALSLYKWTHSGTRFAASILKRTDIMKGTWEELPDANRKAKGFLLISAFLLVLLWDLFVKALNALMLSINTFTTLGFGEIPIKGLPRYLAIIQGFIGWFMLTIFSVSLISQLLN